MKFKFLRSPLNYPGSKLWLVNRVLSCVPPDTETAVSPFIGGGVIELNLAARGIQVYGYDIFEPLTNFWNWYLDRPATIVEIAKNLSQLHTRDSLMELIPNFDAIDNDCEQAGLFYLLNKLSRGGKTLGGWKPYVAPYEVIDGEPVRINGDQRVNVFSQQILQSFIEARPLLLDVFCKPFEESLAMHPNCFAYCDPPYPSEHTIYGEGYKTQFEGHQRLAGILNERENWLLSYNDHPTVDALYSDYEQLEIKRHSGFGGKWHTERLIFSHDLWESYQHTFF